MVIILSVWRPHSGQSPGQDSLPLPHSELTILNPHPTAQCWRNAAVVRQHSPKAPGSGAANMSVIQDLPHTCVLCLFALVWRGDQWVFIISLLTAFLTWSKHNELLITERVIYFLFWVTCFLYWRKGTWQLFVTHAKFKPPFLLRSEYGILPDYTLSLCRYLSLSSDLWDLTQQDLLSASMERPEARGAFLLSCCEG